MSLPRCGVRDVFPNNELSLNMGRKKRYALQGILFVIIVSLFCNILLNNLLKVPFTLIPL